MSWLADRAQDTRFKYPISGFVGANGSGKSFVCAMDTMVDLADGIPVLSTMRFLDWENSRPCDDASCGCDKTLEGRHRAAHPLYTSWDNWDQFMDWTFGVVVADEIMGVAGSGATVSDLPKRVRKKMQKLRHTDLVFRWTGPAWARAEITLREITQAVTVCKGSWKVPAEDSRRRWRQARRITARTYEVEELIDFKTAGADKRELAAKQSIWIPKSPARFAYDTFDRVNEMVRVEGGGRCDVCGRRVREQYCKCVHSEEEDDHGHGRSEPASEDVSGVGPLSAAARWHSSQFGVGSVPGRVIDPAIEGHSAVELLPIFDPSSRRPIGANGSHR